MMLIISYLVEWNVAQVCMVRLVPVGENETKNGMSIPHGGHEHHIPQTLPGGHQHQGQAVDELHPSQGVHPHVHQHAIQNWHGDQPGIVI